MLLPLEQIAILVRFAIDLEWDSDSKDVSAPEKVILLHEVSVFVAKSAFPVNHFASMGKPCDWQLLLRRETRFAMLVIVTVIVNEFCSETR